DFFPNNESASYWMDQPLQINLKRFRRWLSEHALVDKIDEYNKTTVEKKLSDVFVCPPLVRLELKKSEDQATSEPFTSTNVSYDRVFEEDGNIAIFFAPEHGQSSFVRYTALQFLSRNAELRLPRLPLIVDCAYLRNYEASLLGLLKADAPDLISL